MDQGKRPKMEPQVAKKVSTNDNYYKFLIPVFFCLNIIQNSKCENISTMHLIFVKENSILFHHMYYILVVSLFRNTLKKAILT